MSKTCCCPANDPYWCAAARTGVQVYDVGPEDKCDCACHHDDEFDEPGDDDPERM